MCGTFAACDRYVWQKVFQRNADDVMHEWGHVIHVVQRLYNVNNCVHGFKNKYVKQNVNETKIVTFTN